VYHNINISSSAILVQMLALFFPDRHPARFSFAVWQAGAPIRAVPAFCAGGPNGKSACGTLALQ